jgi:hypothetical protein
LKMLIPGDNYGRWYLSERRNSSSFTGEFFAFN